MTSLDTGIAAVRSALTRINDEWRRFSEVPAVRAVGDGLAQVNDSWRRSSRWLNSVMPKGLYARALLIMIMPMVILQSVLAFVFLERQWNEVTQRLSAGVVHDVAALIDVYRGYPQDAERAQIKRIAQQRLGLVVDFLPLGDLPPPGPKPFFSLLDSALSDELRKQIGRPFWIDTVGKSALVEIRVQLDDTVMRVFARRSAAYASSAQIFLLWMFGTSIVLIVVAVMFLRNQIKPILRLADAAESFGKGREVPNFRPRGAREVRRAANAFIEMKTRVERAMEQRTAMLAGVSHDLRTVLTRFNLELALIKKKTPEVEAMKKDVEEMARMLEAYLAFARGDLGELAAPTDMADAHGGAQARRRAQRPQGERRLPRAADRHRAAGGVQALPRQSGVERRALRQDHRDHRPSRPPLAHRHGRRRRPRHSARHARGSVQAVPAPRRRAQSGRGRHRLGARHRARHRALARRRHHAGRQSLGRTARDGQGAGVNARVPGAPQHAMLRRRPGTPVIKKSKLGPGSAVHRSRYALRRIRDTNLSYAASASSSSR